MRAGWIFWVLLVLSGLWMEQALAKGPRPVKVELKEDTEFNGWLFSAGPATLLFPNFPEGNVTLGQGHLAEDTEINGVVLLKGTEVTFSENYLSAKIIPAEDLTLAGVSFAKGASLEFQFFRDQGEGMFNGVALFGTVARDSTVDIYGRASGEKPVRPAHPLNAGDGVTVWCADKPCHEKSKVKFLSPQKLARDTQMSGVELRANETLWIHETGYLQGFYSTKTREMKGQLIRANSDVVFYPDGNLKQFMTAASTVADQIRVDKIGASVKLYPNGAVASVDNLYFVEQFINGRPVSGRSTVTFWKGEETERPNVLRSWIVGFGGFDFAGIHFAPQSHVLQDERGRIREAYVERVIQGVGYQRMRRLVFDEKGKLTDDSALDPKQPYPGEKIGETIPGWKDNEVK